MERMDIYDDMPRDMKKYLSENGWHFNKALCEYAVGKMKDRNGNKISPIEKAKVEEHLRTAGVQLKNDVLHDATYVFNMAMSDFYGSSIKDTASIAHFVKDYLDDIDGSKTRALDEFYGKSIGMGMPIPWVDVL